MVEEMKPYLEDVLAAGHPGVVVALVQACAQSNAQQAAMFDLLLEAFHVKAHPKLCIHTFLSLRTLDSLTDQQESDEVQSAIVQKVSYHPSFSFVHRKLCLAQVVLCG